VTRWWRSHGIRVQLTVWYAVAMTVVLVAYAVAVVAYVSRGASADLNQHLRVDFQWAAAMLEPTDQGTFSWAGDLGVEEDRPWIDVWGADGTLLYRNEGTEGISLDSSRPLDVVDDAFTTIPVGGVRTRVLSRRGRIAGRPVVIQIVRSEGPMREQVRDLTLVLVLGLPIAVATAGIGGYVVARRALDPIERMTERAQSITADRLGDRLPVGNPDNEMGRLATVFNDTLARLERSFAQMRQFTADASHELRTPLTAIRSVGEVGLRGRRDEAGYRAIIGSMLEEVDHLAGLVDRLLTLSRTETRQGRLESEMVELDALAEGVAADLGVLAEEKGQLIEVSSGGAVAQGDRVMLRQALMNLVDNAIKFSPTGSRVVMRTFAVDGRAIVEVSDTGPGVPAAARAHIFDRFYRASADVEGNGLGLAIARSAVEASGGTLTLERTGPDGSTFRLSVPASMPERKRAAV
jgi:signal transduction histidine kinase